MANAISCSRRCCSACWVQIEMCRRKRDARFLAEVHLQPLQRQLVTVAGHARESDFQPRTRGWARSARNAADGASSIVPVGRLGASKRVSPVVSVSPNPARRTSVPAPNDRMIRPAPAHRIGQLASAGLFASSRTNSWRSRSAIRWADSKRSIGSLASSLSMTVASQSGSRVDLRANRAASSVMLRRTTNASAPSNGGRPGTHRVQHAAEAEQVAAVSTGSPLACSGAM